LAGCQGTTGPASINPHTGRPYGSSFPNIAIDDMVNTQKALLDSLGVDQLVAVIGGSMGGFMAMKWAIDYPRRMERCIIIASAVRLSGQALGFEIVGRSVITEDPAYQGGDYYHPDQPGLGQGPRQGLHHARKLAHITYLSKLAMERKLERFDPEKRDPASFRTGFGVEGYLNHQGDKFVERFDANSYLHITWAMDHFDLEQEYGSLHEAFSRVECEVLNINLSSDWLFPPQESRRIAEELLNSGKLVTSVELDSPYGHDGFLVNDMPEMCAVIQRFLEEDHLDKSSANLQELRAAREAVCASDVQHAFCDRADFARVGEMIAPGTRVLDLGCGDGRLISALWRSRKVQGFGMEKELQGMLGCLERDVPAVQWDLDQGLAHVESDLFDYVILNRTLQEVRQPRALLREILRVGRKAVISFPNFGNIKVRCGLLFSGRMPKSENLPWNWYDTPNIHLFTLMDFLSLCAQEGFRVEQLHCLTDSLPARLLLGMGWRNLGAEQVVALVGRA
ncbi:MAG TPA: homoserine O-acetyltransferase, partial [Fibrobacteraceae bacterium]|nr:homoserine O-acetyltransferase [Fibrobacteraceae bacterium]